MAFSPQQIQEFLETIGVGTGGFGNFLGGELGLFGETLRSFRPNPEQIKVLRGWLELGVKLLNEEDGNDSPTKSQIFNRIALLTASEIREHLTRDKNLEIPPPQIDQPPQPFDPPAQPGGSGERITEPDLIEIVNDSDVVGRDRDGDGTNDEPGQPGAPDDPGDIGPETPNDQTGEGTVEEENTFSIGDLLGIIGVGVGSIDLGDFGDVFDTPNLGFDYIPVISEIGGFLGKIFGGGDGGQGGTGVGIGGAAEAIANAIAGDQSQSNNQEVINNISIEIQNAVNEEFQGANAPLGANAGPGSARINGNGNYEILGADGVWTELSGQDGNPISAEGHSPGVGNLIGQAVRSLGPLAGIFLSRALVGDVNEIDLRSSLEELIQLRGEFDNDLVLQDLIADRLNLTGTDEVPGQLGILEDDIAPVIRNIRAENNAFRRRADVSDLEQLGPQFTEALDAATPRRAAALDRFSQQGDIEPSDLLQQMIEGAGEGLGAGRDLTERQVRDTQQATRAAINARGGFERGARPILEEVFANEFARDRREDRNRAFAGQVEPLQFRNEAFNRQFAQNQAQVLGRAEADPILNFLQGNGSTAEVQNFQQGNAATGVDDLFNIGSAIGFNTNAQNQARQDDFDLFNQSFQSIFGP